MSNQVKQRNFQKNPFLVGTRGSPLAVAQARETVDKLALCHEMPNSAFKIKIISTKGDSILDRPLSEVGGKGLFTKEIEEELLNKKIDIAVHSMKDVPTILPAGLEISTVLAREDERDSFISFKYKSINELPLASVVGTSSLRRRAQLLSIRPDLKIVEFRGNVQTRLKKLETGIADATFLACAGLRRLKMMHLLNPVDINQMLPAVAQGAIGIEQRVEDSDVRALLKPLNDKKTFNQLLVERAFLSELDGSCRTPIGGHAYIQDKSVTFYGQILRSDGSEVISDVWTGDVADAIRIGRDAGKTLKEKGGEGFFI